MAGLRLEHIYKVYPNGTKAVSDFTMNIQDQEFIVFVGPSGCGKSTTLRMIAGLEDITAGELYIDDRIVNDVEPKDRDIAMVFQNYALYPHMTVYENMAFGLKLRHVPQAEIHRKVLWAANVLDLVEYLDRKPRAMSGGQRQRVALGRAILRNPKVMLLDEPLSNLDAKLRAQMRSEISKLHDELKTTFIYVTHDQVEAMTLGTRVVVMKLGEIMQIDAPKNLYDYPNNLFVAGFIGTPQMNFFKACLNKNKDKVAIDFMYSENKIEVPYQLLSKVQPQYFDGKTVVTVGLRCEDISLEPEIVQKSTALMDVKISHFEELGNETLIYGDINMDGDGFAETSTRVIIKGTSDYGLKKGQVVQAALNLNKVHIFDSETEQIINPRIPTMNLCTVDIADGKMSFGTLVYDIPKAINVPQGSYEAIVPTNALSLNNNKKGLAVKLDSVEKILDTYLACVKQEKCQLFITTSEPVDTKTEYYLDVDFTQITIQKNQENVVTALAEFDKVDAVFLNYATAKTYVQDKYEGHVAQRLAAVNEKYQPMLDNLNKKYQEDIVVAQKVDSKAIVAKNQPALEAKKKEILATIESLKVQLKTETEELKKIHLGNNAQITKEVNDVYEKIKKEEFESFEGFKAINKDKDAYRKRAQELHEFKSSYVLEKQNELTKRLNLEAVRYESEVNTVKGNFKRTKDGLNKQLNDLEEQFKNEAYPLIRLAKEYKKQSKALKKAFEEEAVRASIIFFFKVDNLLVLSNDSISNKMIQSLGIKVFTKQYIIEIPHDAYVLAEDGLDCEVLNVLNYGTKEYLHCKMKLDGKDQEVYILNNELKLKNVTNIKVSFDITKVHITEKAMNIKIY